MAMNKRGKLKPSILLLVIPLFNSCVEEFNVEFETEVLQNIVVIEATLTDELKHQIIKISSLDSLNSSGFRNTIDNAKVRVIESEGVTHVFNSVGGGSYRSQNRFAANVGTLYSLTVEANGSEFVSTKEILPAKSGIQQLVARRIINDDGVDGIGIFINPTANDESPKFRYEFMETYEIIAPLWIGRDMVVTNREFPFEFDLVPRDRNTRRCFSSNTSTGIILSSDVDFENGMEEDFLVHFIRSDNPVIRNRYSILVEQYSQNSLAQSFYRLLREQSTSENVFSQIQPGFIEGNIRNMDESGNRVIGFFSVESVVSERIFFDYEDFYAGEELPPYFINCSFFGAPQARTLAATSPLLDIIDTGDYVYVKNNEGEVPEGGPFLIARRPCGDCTALGSNIVPEFWEE